MVACERSQMYSYPTETKHTGEKKMLFLFTYYFIFFVIGAMPTLLAGYNPDNWRWWAASVPMFAGVIMHDYSHSL